MTPGRKRWKNIEIITDAFLFFFITFSTSFTFLAHFYVLIATRNCSLFLWIILFAFQNYVWRAMWEHHSHNSICTAKSWREREWEKKQTLFRHSWMKRVDSVCMFVCRQRTWNFRIRWKKAWHVLCMARPSGLLKRQANNGESFSVAFLFHSLDLYVIHSEFGSLWVSLASVACCQLWLQAIRYEWNIKTHSLRYDCTWLTWIRILDDAGANTGSHRGVVMAVCVASL